MRFPGAPMMAERDTGGSSYFAVQYGGLSVLGVQTAVYRGGLVPATTLGAGARSWAGSRETIVPSVVLASAFAVTPGWR